MFYVERTKNVYSILELCLAGTEDAMLTMIRLLKCMTVLSSRHSMALEVVKRQYPLPTGVIPYKVTPWKLKKLWKVYVKSGPSVPEEEEENYRGDAVADKLDTSADKFDTSADKLNTSADKLDAAVDKLDTSADKLDTSADKLNTSADKLDAAVDKLDAAEGETVKQMCDASLEDVASKVSDCCDERSMPEQLPAVEEESEDKGNEQHVPEEKDIDSAQEKIGRRARIKESLMSWSEVQEKGSVSVSDCVILGRMELLLILCCVGSVVGIVHRSDFIVLFKHIDYGYVYNY